MSKFDVLQDKLGYHFKNPEIIRQALTRQSAINEKIPGATTYSYQSLELIGDAIIKAILASLLVKANPSLSEGELNALLEPLIRNDGVMLQIAKSLGVGDLLIKSPAEDITDKVLVDSVEAVVGAVHMDCMSKSEKHMHEIIGVIERLWKPFFPRAELHPKQDKTPPKKQSLASAPKLQQTPKPNTLPQLAMNSKPPFQGISPTKKASPEKLSPRTHRLFTASGAGKKRSLKEFKTALNEAPDINRRNIGSRGDTVLGTICRKKEITENREKMILLLVAAGASWKAKNNRGRTVESIFKSKHPKIAKRILSSQPNI